MADELSTESASADDFFTRCGLDQQARQRCHQFLVERFPGKCPAPAETQGYCSYTVSVDSTVIQFRPQKYALDMKVAAAAKEVYGIYAPSTIFLGILYPYDLYVYTMDKVAGMSYKCFIASKTHIPMARKLLCEDFAVFLARSWHHQGCPYPTGTIGSSIRSRLLRLSTELPQRFRRIAERTLSQLDLIDILPKVLVHGDIVPSNIMLEPSTGHLTGLVDWTEAEALPFGVCLYGLEEILGSMQSDRFVFHAGAQEARSAFWAKLYDEIPELAETQNKKAVQAARVLGILLWHGFAFDDGAIDRVVDEVQDSKEVCYLDTLLGENS